MNNLNHSVALVLLIGAVPLLGIAGQPASKQDSVPHFASLETAEIMKSSFDLIASYDGMVDNLRTQLRDESLSHEGKVYISYVLGELRASRAVPELIDIIDLDASSTMKYRAIEWPGAHPALVALTKIGMPAVEEIGKRFSSESNFKRKEYMCQVIKDTLGEEIGYRFLEKQLTKQVGLSVTTRRDILDCYQNAVPFTSDVPVPKEAP